MPKPKPKKSKQVETKLVSSGCRFIRLDAGIRFERGQENLVEIKWDQLLTVFGFTTVKDGIARLSLHFHLEDRNHLPNFSVVVDEDIDEWQRFNDVLSAELPGFDKGWIAKAAFEEADELADLAPIYHANPILAWQRPGSDLE